MNQATKILKLLKQRKMFGAGNDELNRICFRYSARIKELREEGYNIATVRQKQGYFRYFLIEETE